MKGYEEYKDSGIECIGEVPSHWQLKKLKYIDSVIMGQSPNSSDCNTDRNGLPFLQGNADFGTISPTPTNWCPIPNKIAETNDILLSVRAPIGAINIADQKYGIGRGLCAIRNVKSDMKYQYFQLLCRNDELQALGTGTTYKAINTDNVCNFLSLIPPLDEQSDIAGFLYHKSTKIDSLIDRKRKLIDLLKEERAAIINHAVTKGVSSNAKMKDSGIEWMGEIPNHWSLTKLKYFVSITKGFAFKSSNFSDTGIPVVRASDIKNHSIRESGIFVKDVDQSIIEKVSLYENDIILSTVGSKSEVIESAVGQIGKVPKNIAGAVLNQNTVRFSPNSDIIYSDFFFHFLKSFAYRKFLDIHAHGTANQASLNIEDMLNFQIALPDISEQIAINQYISTCLSKIDNTLEVTARGISLIEEYRTALINEAVTGKIDVREKVPA